MGITFLDCWFCSNNTEHPMNFRRYVLICYMLSHSSNHSGFSSGVTFNSEVPLVLHIEYTNHITQTNNITSNYYNTQHLGFLGWICIIHETSSFFNNMSQGLLPIPLLTSWVAFRSAVLYDLPLLLSWPPWCCSGCLIGKMWGWSGEPRYGLLLFLSRTIKV